MLAAVTIGFTARSTVNSKFRILQGGPEILQSRYMNMYGMLNGMWPGPAAVPGMPPVVTVQSPSPNGAPSSPTTSSNIGVRSPLIVS